MCIAVQPLKRHGRTACSHGSSRRLRDDAAGACDACVTAATVAMDRCGGRGRDLMVYSEWWAVLMRGYEAVSGARVTAGRKRRQAGEGKGKGGG